MMIRKNKKPPLKTNNNNNIEEEIKWGGVNGERKLLWYGTYTSAAYSFLSHPFSLSEETSIPLPFDLPLGPGCSLPIIL